MKSIHVTFEDHEFESLLKAKEDLSWHDFILVLVHFDPDKMDLLELRSDYLSECFEEGGPLDWDEYLSRIESAGLASVAHRLHGTLVGEFQDEV